MFLKYFQFNTEDVSFRNGDYMKGQMFPITVSDQKTDMTCMSSILGDIFCLYLVRVESKNWPLFTGRNYKTPLVFCSKHSSIYCLYLPTIKVSILDQCLSGQQVRTLVAIYIFN